MWQILVADDLRAIYGKINSVLDANKYEVEYAKNGKEAYKKASSKTYDLILLDIHMPEMDGIEACTLIKSLPQHRYTPVMFITSDQHQIQKGFEAGASDYIMKPFNEHELSVRVAARMEWGQHKKQLELEKNKLISDLNSKEGMLNEMQRNIDHYFYQTSHKLRSPINTIYGLFNLLEKEFPEVKNNEFVNLIEKSVHKMSMVNDQISQIGFLNYSNPRFSKVQLSKLIHNLIASLDLPKESFNIDIDPLIWITTDTRILQMGLKPVILNAFKYTMLKGGVAEPIDIHFSKMNDQYLLLIKDYGIGIEKNQIQKIFEMFHVATDLSDGSGLGLFITKMALIILEGTIGVESIVGECTTFTIGFKSEVIELHKSLEG